MDMSSQTRDELPPTEAARAAALLVRAGCVLLAEEGHAFTLTSGRRAPAYVNLRGILWHPTERDGIVDVLAGMSEFLDDDSPEDLVLVGAETAGIPLAAMTAMESGMRAGYVRRSDRAHGTASMVEGGLPSESHCVLVDDVITDGGSKVAFVNTLRACGHHCDTVMVVFDGSNGLGEPALRAHDLRLVAACDWNDVTTVLGVVDGIRVAQLKELIMYLEDRDAWSTAHARAPGPT